MSKLQATTISLVSFTHQGRFNVVILPCWNHLDTIRPWTQCRHHLRYLFYLAAGTWIFRRKPHVLGLAVSEYNNKIPIVKLPTDRSRGTLFLADSILRAHAGLHPSSFHLVPPVNPRHFSSRKENELNASLRYGPVIADSSLTPTRTMILPPRGARSASREFAPKRCTAPTIYLWIIFDGWVASELERFSHLPLPEQLENSNWINCDRGMIPGSWPSSHIRSLRGGILLMVGFFLFTSCAHPTAHFAHEDCAVPGFIKR